MSCVLRRPIASGVAQPRKLPGWLPTQEAGAEHRGEQPSQEGSDPTQGGVRPNEEMGSK